MIGVDIFIIGSAEMHIEPAYPHVRTSWSGDDVLILPAPDGSSQGQVIDQIEMTFTAAGLFDSAQPWSSRPIELNCTSEEDSDTSTSLAAWYSQMSAKLSKEVGSLGTALDSTSGSTSLTACTAAEAPDSSLDGFRPSGVSTSFCGCRVDACAQGSFVADAFRHAANADFAIINSGALSAKTLSTGTVTTGDLVELLPFANEVVKLRLPGSAIRAALTNGISRLSQADVLTNPSGRFPQISSTLEVDWFFQGGVPTLSHVYHHLDTDGIVETSPPRLNDTHIYTVATNDYLANGGDGYSAFLPYAVERLGLSDAATLASYLQSGYAYGPDWSSSTDPVPYGERIQQSPDMVVLQMGIMCRSGKVGEAGYVKSTYREECDHMKFLVDRINDKSDGFLDHLL